MASSTCETGRVETRSLLRKQEPIPLRAIISWPRLMGPCHLAGRHRAPGFLTAPSRDRDSPRPYEHGAADMGPGSSEAGRRRRDCEAVPRIYRPQSLPTPRRNPGAAGGGRHQRAHCLVARGGAVACLHGRQPGHRSVLYDAEFPRRLFRSAHLHRAARHDRLRAHRAGGGARLRGPVRLAGRAHRSPGQDVPIHPDGGRPADPRLRARDGLVVPAASAHRLVEPVVDEQSSPGRRAAQHRQHRRHGLRAGTEPRCRLPSS